MNTSSPTRLRRRFRAETEMRAVIRDFSCAGLPIESLDARIEVGSHGTLTARLDVAGRSLSICAENPQRLAVAVASFLQDGEFLRGNDWPTVPGLGLLRPIVQGDRAVWALPDGAALCELGRLFESDGCADGAGGARERE